MKRRVVVTGMGAVSPIGNTVDELWTGIENGVCGIDFITHFDTTDYKVKLAGEVKNLDMEQYFTRRDLKFNDRFTQFARICAKQAIEDSKIDLDAIDKERFGVLIASGIGGIETIESAQKNMEDRGPSKVSPFFIPMALVNLAAGSIAIDYGAKGHCSACVTACAAATNAIGEAFHKIRDGYEDMMLAGGSEASITPLAIAGFQSMRALHTGIEVSRASIPFDNERSGFVMGEGAGVLFLEEYEHAKKRNAKIYGEIVGYGATCDAHHITAPLDDGTGGAKAMIQSVKDASLNMSDIDYINAHGTSTPLNDKTETKAVKYAFGEHAKNVYMSSTKSNTGHLLGASGAIEAIITIKALENNFVPPTINYINKDENCDLNIVPNKPVKTDLHYAMSNSLGFGGHNASLVFKKMGGLNMIYNSNQIQEIIPHRYPFLLVDQIDEINEEGTSITGHKCVSANEMHFLGHFPQKHVMPGVLIVEALAQTGCVLLLSKEENKGKIGYFAGINKMRFKRQVIPGDVLTLKVTLTNSRAGIYFADVIATVNEEIAAKGEIMCALGD